MFKSETPVETKETYTGTYLSLSNVRKLFQAFIGFCDWDLVTDHFIS